MKRLVEYVARSLVDNPDAVKVAEVASADGFVVFEVSCDAEEKGKIIGKAGRTARAFRTLVRSVGARQGRRVTVEIV